MLPPRTVLNERYQLIEPIGDGGMATVYRALDMRLARTVAVKVLHPEYARDTPFLQRFQQEAEFAASLGAHPNIVAIYDIGDDDSLHYIVMELIEGKSLKDIIRERAPLIVDEAFSIGRQVALALDFAHKRGLIHRDVKPQNIMVTSNGIAKVTDFGIARSLSASQLTRTGMVIGTVHYFSPEQAQGKPVTPASDIYSLGIILYEVLTAHLPFDAENAIGVAMQHLHEPPPNPRVFNPTLPSRVVDTVMRALEKDPAQRYRDAAEFAGALTAGMSPAAAGTTMLQPIVQEAPPAERTTMYRAVEPAPIPARQRRTVPPAREVVAPARALPPKNNTQRNTWIALAALLLFAGIATAAYFATSHAVGGGATSTPTPTVTPTPQPTAKPKKHHRRPTAAPTFAVVYQATATPLPQYPTYTPTSVPPTFTPQPQPTNTPVVPTATPQPTAAPTVELIGPTATPTVFG